MLDRFLAQVRGFLPEDWLTELGEAPLTLPPEISMTAAAAALLAGFLFMSLRKRARAGALPDLVRLTCGPRRLGYATAFVFFGAAGGWSAQAPIAGAALAPGVVSPDGARKTVQHLEGGIIRAIHVREGDVVSVGQELVTLEDVAARARHNEVRERYIYLLAMEARLEAERAGGQTIVFPPELIAAEGSKTRLTMEGQKDLFVSRVATLLGREDILRQRVRQLEEQNRGLRAMIVGLDDQLSLFEDEIADAFKLLEQGLVRRPRYLALKRAAADIRVQQASSRAQIARNEQEIGGTQFQLLSLRQEHQERVNQELTETRRTLAELRAELPFRQDVLTRTVVKAPIAGAVMNLQVTTQSGVVAPGQSLLDIVPVKTALIIDAQVKPIDIDTVNPGMRARVLLTAYGQRSLPQIHGALRTISADRMIEDRSGEPYFLAKIQVDETELSRLPGVRLTPGMPAEVMILTGERTLLDYLMRPLLESVTKSFREG